MHVAGSKLCRSSLCAMSDSGCSMAPLFLCMWGLASHMCLFQMWWVWSMNHKTPKRTQSVLLLTGWIRWNKFTGWCGRGSMSRRPTSHSRIAHLTGNSLLGKSVMPLSIFMSLLVAASQRNRVEWARRPATFLVAIINRVCDLGTESITWQRVGDNSPVTVPLTGRRVDPSLLWTQHAFMSRIQPLLLKIDPQGKPWFDDFTIDETGPSRCAHDVLGSCCAEASATAPFASLLSDSILSWQYCKESRNAYLSCCEKC